MSTSDNATVLGSSSKRIQQQRANSQSLPFRVHLLLLDPHHPQSHHSSDPSRALYHDSGGLYHVGTDSPPDSGGSLNVTIQVPLAPPITIARLHDEILNSYHIPLVDRRLNLEKAYGSVARDVVFAKSVFLTIDRLDKEDEDDGSDGGELGEVVMISPPSGADWGPAEDNKLIRFMRKTIKSEDRGEYFSVGVILKYAGVS